MYITDVRINNIRTIATLWWRLRSSQPPAGWHVIAGDNGSGKTSFLRAVALALVGPKTAQQLRQSWEQWLAKGKKAGRVSLALCRNEKRDRFSGSGTAPRDLRVTVRLDRKEDDTVHLRGGGGDRSVWGTRSRGWFSASYGPLRRFTGGDPDSRRMFYQFPRLGRHLSLFDERVALTECLEWLRDLRFKEYEQAPEGKLLAPLKEFINQEGFLPFRAHLGEITSSAVRFVDGNGADVEVENLSDGYRSVLSMTFELIRQLAEVYGAGAVFDPNDPTKVAAPGVVLVDEIDAHLHPTWQRRIGFWLRDHFPNIQFIVTSHSPLVCGPCDRGSIYRLPRPGAEESGGMVVGDELRRLTFGNVLDAYGTEVFGENVASTEQSRDRRRRLAELNVKEKNAGLSSEERSEQDRLRRTLPTSAAALD